MTTTVPRAEPTAATTGEPAGKRSRHARDLGLPVTTALVMGNIIGGGIFLLPASVAPFRTVSLVAFAVLTVGAIALALVFGRLAERHPRTGGPCVYAREAFGDFADAGVIVYAWMSARNRRTVPDVVDSAGRA